MPTVLATPPARHPLPVISYPAELPVAERADEIAQAIAAHPVVIVCGETGSGKTTQLPKICLALGRGKTGLIGHTQPRRLAATATARRIAQELNTPLGEVIGYKVRFNDKLEKGAWVKLMTDGILLAETQGDPLLRLYDTIIIDEAHERSLNIDFLLGYLKEILPQRPDLKIIITSATIDADRFAKHFGSEEKPAPVVNVSGRLYPVEVRYRPIQENEKDKERDLYDGIVDAVAELSRLGSGDVLVFLPGEREIREAAEALRKHHPPHVEILPLFARLSAQEQERIFHPTNTRRIVLATNVAETSLTVPGIRYVVDSGLARVKRYSYRNKVEQLQIEPIAQAAANQRAGRCGRVAAGVCIRLYDEADFNARAKFTDPEIQRSSLAAVILRMKALRLTDIEAFPFIEPPSGKAIADGYQLLQELGALDDDNTLTDIGRALAKLPLDPRIARMVLAAQEQHCLHEVLIIASALEVQDPRDRPLEAQDAADNAHKKFADDKSDFLSYLKLWKWFEEAVEHKKSNRQLMQHCRENFVSQLRLREWRDVHSQLHTTVAEQGWKLNATPATYEQIHCALLSGLLGNVACKMDDDPQYLGARGIKLMVWPGSALAKKSAQSAQAKGKWIMAAELVDTSRLFARCAARIEPVWIERLAGHLLKKSYSDPHWERKAAQVTAMERATLYGLTVYAQRRIDFGRINPTEARTLFIREALVNMQYDSQAPFFQHNRKLVADIEQLEHKTRRPDVLVDEALIEAFYDQRIPQEVHSGSSFEAWRKLAEADNPKLLYLNRDELMRHEAAGVTTDVFPKTMVMRGLTLALSYHFEPGVPRDGVTMAVPLAALNQIDPLRCEWLVPGMLKEKAHLLLKSLPQKLRRHCVPLPNYAAGFVERRTAESNQSLTDALIADIREQITLVVQPADFKLETLPQHLFMNFKVVDEQGRQLGMGRNLAALRAELGGKAQQAFQRVAETALEVQPQPDTDATPAGLALQQGLTGWTFDALPDIAEIQRGGQTLIGYPALVDRGSHCDIDLFDEEHKARQAHRLGLRRLFALQLKEQLKFLEKNLADLQTMGMLYLSLGSLEELRQQLLDAALERACLSEPWPATAAAFGERVQQAKGRLGLLAQELARQTLAILQEYVALQKKLPQIKSFAEARADIAQQLEALLPKEFILRTPVNQYGHLARYLKALSLRADKLRSDPTRDAQRMGELRPLLQQYQRTVAGRKGQPDSQLDEFRWLLEELRVSLFAQELRTPMPVSIKRLHKLWTSMQC
ncbi:MAG: ATP-dependent RNA helicase HrpA [Burkholderiaceae bacterium]|nr:MAG: ATP-dependent RNA helicase HrpA [Burkholderiaceae bacterium]